MKNIPDGKADVITFPVENETQRILREALMRLGPNGENWHQGFYSNVAGDRVCSIGSVNIVCGLAMDDDRNVNHPAHVALVKAANAAGYRFPAWLNDRAQSFSEVRAMFEKAIELAA